VLKSFDGGAKEIPSASIRAWPSSPAVSTVSTDPTHGRPRRRCPFSKSLPALMAA
jgi:hypothetical protein